MPLLYTTPLSSFRSERFPRNHRVVRRRDYLRIQQYGYRVRTSHFVCMLLPYPGEQRLGITVTSKIGCAVQRNRIKRVAREVFRRNRELFPPDCETVIVARLGAHRLGYRAMLEELQSAKSGFSEYIRHINSIASGD